MGLKITNFVRKIIKSIYSPEFYRSIPNTTTSSALLYFFILSALLLIIEMSTSIVPMYQQMNNFANSIRQISNQYPEQLRISIKDGEVTTNVKEPYIVPFPKGLEEEDMEFPNIIAIDTKSAFSQNKFNSYKSFVWLTKDTLFINRNSETRAYSLSEIKDFNLDKNKVGEFVAKFSPWLSILAPAFVVMMVLLLFLLKANSLIYLFFLAFLLWIIAKLFKLNLPYGQVYKIGIYAITLGLIIQTIIEVLKPIILVPTFSFMFTIIFMCVFAVNVLFHKNLWIKAEKK